MSDGVKTFEFEHHFFVGKKTHSETELPNWLMSNEYKWFLDRCVLTLKAGEFVDTDFHRITRTL